jgi:TonB-linked SusC/RagA family outer membrane protein
MKRKLLTILYISLLLCFPINLLYSQTQISGRVTAESDKQPLPGVNVFVEGTTDGTITDINGEFSLEVLNPDTSRLVFSYVGYIKQVVEISDSRYLEIQLREDIEQLEEIVVIGYGTSKKEDLTGAVAVVDMDELEQTKDISLDRALQGRASGVYVSSSSGQPGSGASVKIRGVGSINMESEPLYIVDGNEISSNNITHLSPSNIASISVLKDASATAIYGARGANGVILIETIRGNRDGGRPSVNLESFAGFARVANMYEPMSASQYADFYRQAYTAFLDDMGLPFETPENIYYHVYSDSARAANNNLETNRNHLDLLYRTAFLTTLNANISGGAENINYSMGASYSTEEGTLENTGYRRINFYINSDADLLKWLRVGQSINIVNARTNELKDFYENGPLLKAGVQASPFMRDIIDESQLGGYGGLNYRHVGKNDVTNIFAEQNLYSHTNDRLMAYTNAYIEIEPLPNLNYRLSANYNFGLQERDLFKNAYTFGDLTTRDHPVNERLYNRDISDRFWQLGQLLSYNNSVGELNYSFVLGWERNYRYNDFIKLTARDYESQEVITFLNAANNSISDNKAYERKMESYLGRLVLDFRNTYFLTASLRADGSSNIAPVKSVNWLPEHFGAFPSLSAGWKLNENISFLSDLEAINLLKLRAGWGITGNQNINPYQYYNFMTAPDYFRYTLGTGQTLVLGAGSYHMQPNENIKWEEARMTNIGLDLNMFDNRLQITAEYYNKNQVNMLVRQPLSVSMGKASGEKGWYASPWVNLGKVNNQGAEFSIGWKQSLAQFFYSLSGNLTTIQNKVIDLGERIPDIYSQYAQQDVSVTRAGHQIGSFYGHIMDGVFQNQDEIDNHSFQNEGTRPGDFKFRDLNSDGIVDNQDRTIIGKPIPDLIYGFSGNFEFRNFDLVMVFQGMYGFDVLNAAREYIGIATLTDPQDVNKLVSVYEDAWTGEGSTQSQTRISLSDPNYNRRHSTYFIEDGSFLRFKTLQLGFSFPDNWVENAGIRNLRIYGSIDNVTTFTDYSGLDPELSGSNPLFGGIDSFNYPVSRKMIFGIQLNF